MKIAKEAFRFGSIQRKTYQRYVKRYLYRYRGVYADLVNGNEFIVDDLMEELADAGVIAKSGLEAYYQALTEYIHKLPEMKEETDEEIYREVLNIRETYRTAATDRYLNEKKEKINCEHWSDNMGIDQSNVFWTSIGDGEFATLMLMEGELLQACLDTYRRLKGMGVQTRVLVQAQEDLDTRITGSCWLREAIDPADLIQIDTDKFGFPLHEIELRHPKEVVVGFGEWFVGVMRSLNTEAYIVCQSKEILTRAVTNSIDKNEFHWIAVPSGFDLIQSIPIVERAVVNYRVLSWISEEHGMGAYQLSLEEMMNKYPAYFLHGSSDKNCTLPFETREIKSTEDFQGNRKESIFQWVKKQAPGVEMGEKTILDRHGDPMKVTYAKLSQLQGYKPQVFSSSKAQEIRSFFRESEIDYGLAMNFLFFATDKSVATYNQMRKKRPLEQVNQTGWHIDYRKNESGETFPLYAKAAIGSDQDGNLHFFRKRLGAGEIRLNDQRVAWTESEVDPELVGEFCIFTPYAISRDTEAYLTTREVVGEGRVNLVIVNDRVVAIRRGGVILPNIGVVLSFLPQAWQKFFPCAEFDDHGYACADDFHFVLSLDKTEDYQWVYGGAMFLIYRGETFDTEEKLQAEFRKEGWLSDLSKQTQDSETFRLEKHPRSIIGMTKSGEFFMTVVSGRSKYSVGADYLDLIQIANDLFEDVEMLMNVDGGASSFMGIVYHGEVLEVSDVTFTNDSAAGTLRPLNSIFTITKQK